MKEYVKEAEDLEVFKKSYSCALELHKLTLNFPKIEQFELASQMRRASKSICANIAEGFAKQTHSSPEFRRFLSISIGSAKEIDIWLKFCLDLGYISVNDYNRLTADYLTISKMLQKFRSNIKD